MFLGSSVCTRTIISIIERLTLKTTVATFIPITTTKVACIMWDKGKGNTSGLNRGLALPIVIL